MGRDDGPRRIGQGEVGSADAWSAEGIVSALADEVPRDRGLSCFFSDHYKERNRARLAHLASLGLPLENRSVLDLGSGPGDHTEFYLARGCRVVAVDARRECLDYLQRRFPSVRVACIDMNDPSPLAKLGAFEVVHCYGLLYHLEEPGPAIAAMAQVCSGVLILETCLSGDGESGVKSVVERKDDFTQAVSGRGCRPSRRWVFAELRKHFEFVYQTRTQPNHPEFPTDWREARGDERLIRAVFVASRHRLDLSTLSEELLERQVQMAPHLEGDWKYSVPRVGRPEGEEEEALSEHPVCWCGVADRAPFYGRYFRCRNCGTVYLKREGRAAEWLVDEDELGIGGTYPWAASSADEAAAYEADWPRRAAAVLERNLVWLRTLLKYSLPGAQVLVAGSPHESFVTLLRLAGFSVAVLDPHQGVIREASGFSGEPPAGGGIGRGVAVRARFDAVAAMEVMRRWPEPFRTLEKCAELLAPGGFLMAEAACLVHGDFSYEDLVETNDPLLPEIQQEGSLHLFTQDAMAMLAARLGFPRLVFEGLRMGRYALFVAGGGELRSRTGAEIAASLRGSREGRVVLALLDLEERLVAEGSRREAAAGDRAVLATAWLDAREAYEQERRTAEERLSALNTTDAALREIHQEAERRAEGMLELAAEIEARDARLRELERTAEERLAALEETTAALEAERQQCEIYRAAAEERLRALLETDAALRRERAARESVG